MSKHRGGPAFPIRAVEFSDGSVSKEIAGMTLLDWFAGMALAGRHHHHMAPDEIAVDAYEIADAMLKEREIKL